MSYGAISRPAVLARSMTTHDKKFQRGLVPADKAERVSRYSKTMRKEIGVIAHSCGVSEPRQLCRYHCRIVQADGRSIPLNELYPDAPQAAERKG